MIEVEWINLLVQSKFVSCSSSNFFFEAARSFVCRCGDFAIVLALSLELHKPGLSPPRPKESSRLGDHYLRLLLRGPYFLNSASTE